VTADYYRGILIGGTASRITPARAFFPIGAGDRQRLLGKDAYAADYVLLDYLDGLVWARLTADGSDRVRARARAHAAGRPGDAARLPIRERPTC
jgi:hypothetical protein